MLRYTMQTVLGPGQWSVSGCMALCFAWLCHPTLSSHNIHSFVHYTRDFPEGHNMPTALVYLPTLHCAVLSCLS